MKTIKTMYCSPQIKLVALKGSNLLNDFSGGDPQTGVTIGGKDTGEGNGNRAKRPDIDSYSVWEEEKEEEE